MHRRDVGARERLGRNPVAGPAGGTGAGCTVIFSYCFSSPPFSNPARDPGTPRGAPRNSHTPLPFRFACRRVTYAYVRDAPNFLRLLQEGARSGTEGPCGPRWCIFHALEADSPRLARSRNASALRPIIISDTDRKDTSIGREVKIR